MAMENLISLGVPKSVVAFVMPTGYSFNLTGTTLYLSLAALFAAQAGSVSMSIGEQLSMMVTLMLTSKGVAAVPRASLLILSSACVQFRLPIDAVSVILGVDEIMDMARSACNVLGNCVACLVISKLEGNFVLNEQSEFVTGIKIEKKDENSDDYYVEGYGHSPDVEMAQSKPLY